MNKVLIIIGVAISCGIVVFFSMHKKPEQREIKQGAIVIVGDSLVSGVGARKGNDIVSVLSQRLGEEVVNAGITGDTTAGVLARLDSDVLVHNPAIVVVVIGGNDFLRRISKETTLSNVRMILQKIKTSGARVVLVGIDTLVYNGDYRTIAKELDALFISNMLGSVRTDGALMSDPIHPNDAGYVLFADAIEKEIRELRP